MRHLIVDLETAPIDDAATYVEPVSAPSNYKDEAKIAAYVAEKQGEQVSKCALDPDLCRIVALGSMRPDDVEPRVDICPSEVGEALALESFWRRMEPHSFHATLVGFNLLNFDARILLRRSLYLGVKAPDLQVERWKHPQIEDLMLRLCWNDPYKAHSLSFYVNRFGLPAVDDDVTGADIGELVKAGDWPKVAQHCRADVLRTLYLARRLGVVSASAPAPVVETVF
jgi:hypothetical protein